MVLRGSVIRNLDIRVWFKEKRRRWWFEAWTTRFEGLVVRLKKEGFCGGFGKPIPRSGFGGGKG